MLYRVIFRMKGPGHIEKVSRKLRYYGAVGLPLSFTVDGEQQFSLILNDHGRFEKLLKLKELLISEFPDFIAASKL